MELNRVLSSVVVMAMILFINDHATAEASCFQDCLNTCHDGSPALCVKKCFQECPVPPSPAPIMIDYAAPPSVTPDAVIDFPLAEERCFEKCINECKLPKEVECVGPCFDKCPFPPSLAPNNVLNYHKAAVSEDSCFQDCLNTCHGSPAQCVKQCFQKCPVPPSAAADVPNSCFQDCLNTCHGSPAQCVKQCFQKCPIPPSAATDVVNDLYRCKLGCSLHQCSKYSSDNVKMGSCMNHCSIKNCDIKEPSPL